MDFPVGDLPACTCGPYWSVVPPPPCPHHSSAQVGYYLPLATISPNGWRCPGCTTVWAPSVAKCDRCGPRSDFLDRVDPPEGWPSR